MTPKDKHNILTFCASVQKGFGSISDVSVKKEYERIFETNVDVVVLAELLSVLEHTGLIDKKNSINKDPFFYRKMRDKV